MGYRDNISIDDGWFIGEDKQLDFTVYTTSAKTVIREITGFALEFLLRRTDDDAEPHVIRKTTGGSGVAISGTFNSAPGTNTQKAAVTIDDTDTDGLAPGIYHYVLRRTDAGSEGVIAYGTAQLQLAGGR